MIDDFFEFLNDNCLFTDQMISDYGVYRIAKEFLQSYPQYMNDTFRHYIIYDFIPKMKRNICDEKLEEIDNDFCNENFT